MKNIFSTILVLFLCNLIFADGIIIVNNNNYPGTILKNKSTSVEVNIDGLLVKTVSIQEFQNEWDQTIDGVYSFPLPLNARTTRLMYSKGDTLIDAVLKVIPQSINPGTGEGGLVAEINQYMGQNVVRLKLTDIQPNAIKWIRLEYVMDLNHYKGNISYSYPLNTEGFYTTPLDFLSVNINIHSEQLITDFEMPSHPNYIMASESDNDLNIIMVKPNSYQATDINFNYTVEIPDFALDFYSWDTDTADGYFTMVGRPRLSPYEHILPNNIFFLIDNSSTMIGEKINQSKQAVIQSLDELTPTDSFNIAMFNYSPTFWQGYPVIASPENIAAAKLFVEDISAMGGSNIGYSLSLALEQVANTSFTSSILVFTDGKGSLNPYEIETQNTNKTGIFFIAFTDKVDRHRLETTAQLNYGFVTYLDRNSILSSEMVKIFKKINQPLIKDVDISFSSGDVYDLYPTKFPAIYLDSDFKITGRYTTPGSTTITIDGIDDNGYWSFEYIVDFNGSGEENDIARNFWVKDIIMDYESHLLIEGEDETQKEELIDISLSEKMRCRYTAYVEDTTYASFTDSIFFQDDNLTDIDDCFSANEKVNVFPNPVFDSFTVSIDLATYQNAESKIIEIYDISGKLVFKYDFSHEYGLTFSKRFNKKIFNNSSGVFLLNVIVNGKIIETKSIICSK